MPSALFDSLLLNASKTSVPRSKIPPFLYGCAWKKERTTELVYEALSSGFKGLDVAAQPRHYREDLAGEGVRKVLAEGKVKREDLFVQTKFTSVDGQDPDNLPYDPKLGIAEQVKTSIASSLRNLRHGDGEEASYIDSFVLHSPLRTMRDTMEAWQAVESFVPHKIRNLGISNTSLEVLESLWKRAVVKPSVVQNRFYSDTGYDNPLRAFCRKHGIIYQSFWTLSANPKLLHNPSVGFIAKAVTVDPQVAFYCLVLGLEDLVILNGTQTHMSTDLEGLDKVRQWALENKYEWENTLKHFKDATGDNDPGPMQEGSAEFKNRYL